jgi:hypothetical protein
MIARAFSRQLFDAIPWKRWAEPKDWAPRPGRVPRRPGNQAGEGANARSPLTALRGLYEGRPSCSSRHKLWAPQPGMGTTAPGRARRGRVPTPGSVRMPPERGWRHSNRGSTTHPPRREVDKLKNWPSGLMPPRASRIPLLFPLWCRSHATAASAPPRRRYLYLCVLYPIGRELVKGKPREGLRRPPFRALKHRISDLWEGIRGIGSPWATRKRSKRDNRQAGQQLMRRPTRKRSKRDNRQAG